MNFEKYISKSVKELPIFLLLDNSGSMAGEKIEVLNQSVKEMIVDFQDERLTDVLLKICIITFGSDATLHTDLKPLKELDFIDLVAGGMTPLGGALKIAQDIITDKNKVPSKSYRPVVILVSDGEPNDNWESAMNDFNTNKRTSKVEKWALGIGSNTNFDVLKKFLNDPNKPVFDASVSKEISSFFKFVTLSTISRSKSLNPNTVIDLEQLEKQMNRELPKFDFGIKK